MTFSTYLHYYSSRLPGSLSSSPLVHLTVPRIRPNSSSFTTSLRSFPFSSLSTRRVHRQKNSSEGSVPYHRFFSQFIVTLDPSKEKLCLRSPSVSSSLSSQLKNSSALPNPETLQIDYRWLWHNAPSRRMPGVNQKTVTPIEVMNAPRIRSVTVPSTPSTAPSPASSSSTANSTSSSLSLPNDNFSLTVEWMDGTKDTFTEEFWKKHPLSAYHIQETVANTNPLFLGHPIAETVTSTSTSSRSSSPSTLYIPPVRSVSSTVPIPSHSTTSFSSRYPPIGKSSIPQFDYRTVLNDEHTLYQALQDINDYGLIILTHTSTKENTVIEAANRLAYAPMRTLYGLTWDVTVTPQPINIAYAPGSLDFHVDLVYYESPPGLQLLHCRFFDSNVIGGESTFVDGFYAAEVLRQRNPEAFRTLTRLPATFEKIHYNRPEPAHMRSTRPHIAVRRSPARSLLSSSSSSSSSTSPAVNDDIVTGIFWAPPFEGPLMLHPDDMEAYYNAYGAFANVLADIETDGKMLIEYRSDPGEIVVFNNRRILHGRRNFTTPVTLPSDTASALRTEEIGGRRILQGCYINADDWKSRLGFLHQKYRSRSTVKRVGNQDIL